MASSLGSRVAAITAVGTAVVEVGAVVAAAVVGAVVATAVVAVGGAVVAVADPPQATAKTRTIRTETNSAALGNPILCRCIITLRP